VFSADLLPELYSHSSRALASSVSGNRRLCVRQSPAACPDLRRRIQLVLGDAREADVQAFGVVALYLLEEGHRLMRPMLERRLKKGTRIVAHGWPVPGWDASEVEVMPSGTRVYLYIR